MKRLIFYAFQTIALLTVLFIAVSTTSVAIGMSDGTMFSCPLMMMDHSAMCPMTILDHLVGWELMFAAIREYSVTITLLLAVALSLYWFSVRRIVPDSSPPPQWYRESTITYQLHRYLLSAFSQGILHPKLYT